MLNSSPEISVVGGASLPGALGTVSVSWPLATATADAEGVTVNIRPSFLTRRFLDPDAASGTGSSAWKTLWSDVSYVEVGHRSLVIYVTGRRGCRFVVISSRKLRPLVAEFEHRSLTVKKVRTTLGWFLK